MIEFIVGSVTAGIFLKIIGKKTQKQKRELTIVHYDSQELDTFEVISTRNTSTIHIINQHNYNKSNNPKVKIE